MIVKHEFSNIIITPKRENFFDFLTQARNTVSKLKETLNILNDAEAGDIDEFDELDALECQKIEDYEALVHFSTGGYTAKTSMYVCTKDIVFHISKYNNILSECIGYGVFLTEDSRNTIREYCRVILSEIAYVLWFEFDIEPQLEALNSSEELIDEIIKMYCDSFSYTQLEILEDIRKLREEFPFHLSIFDDYPEYQADFEAVMGPYMGSLIEKDLTVDQIQKVISGEITPEALVESFQGQEASYSSDSLNDLKAFS